MSNTIADLREHLFATLRDLRRKDDPMEIDRARAVSEVAQTIINTAKVEVDHMRVAGGTGSGFIPTATPALPGRQGHTSVTQLAPGATVTRHRMGE